MLVVELAISLLLLNTLTTRSSKRHTHTHTHTHKNILWCHQLLYGFVDKCHLPLVSCQSDKGDNVLNTGDVHRSPEFSLRLRKTLARKPSDEGCATSHGLKWGPLLPNDIGRFIQNSKEGKEGKKEVGLSGLGVTCSPRDPRFAGSNAAEIDGFFQDVKILSTSPPDRL